MNPLVSVVITTYNQAAFIAQTLDSVFAQTYESYEVIVIDDGSSDDTPARIEPFEPRITYVRQKNLGVAGARNAGIIRARGEFIAFLDGDDLWEPDKLAVQVAAAQAHPESGLIVVDGLEFDEGGTISPSLFFEPWCREIPEGTVQSGRYYRELLQRSFITTTSQVMVPARVFREVGWSDDRFERASDYDLYIRIAGRFEVTVVKKRLIRWRYSSGSVSGTRSRRGFRYLPEDIAILKKHLGLSRGEDRMALRGIVRARISAGAEKLYYYGLEQDRGFAARALWQLWTKNAASPRVLLYLAGLWCPDAVRNRLGRLVRSLLYQG